MYNLNHGHIPLTTSLKKPLGLFPEVLYNSYFAEHHKHWVEKIPEYAKQFGFNQINIHQAALLPHFCGKYTKYPLMSHPIAPEVQEEIAYFRSYLKTYKEMGLRITCGFGGPDVPMELLEKYPEAKNVQSGVFCDFIEEMVVEYFGIFPECDCLEIYLWENEFTSDRFLVFPQLYWGGPEKSALYSTQPYFSPADILAAVLTAYAKGAQRCGKEFSILTFSHYPWQEKLLIEAIERMDSSLPLILDHKCQPGDWDPNRPVNNVLEHLSQKGGYMLFDGAGEYWGQCRVPFCIPEDIQFRLQHALNYNPNLTDLGMRVMWQFDNLFDNYNEINFYALMRFSKDPWIPIEQVWQDWATQRFGAEAAPAVISALSRTQEIGKKIFYILGCWANNHSTLPGLAYIESHTINFGRALYEWKPMDYINEGIYREFSSRPREITVGRALKEKTDALALVEASIRDIESVLHLLTPEESRRITHQFDLLRDYTIIVTDHTEAFIRYWIEKKNPTEAALDNREKLQAALERLESRAAFVEHKYGDSEPMLKASHITQFISDVKKALAVL